MLKRAGARKSKRAAPGRGSKSPPDSAPPAAKRAAAAGRPASPAVPPTGTTLAAVELSAGALAAIQQLIDSASARVISVFDQKFEVLERRVSILEGECFDKDEEIRHLKNRLERQDRAIEDLQQCVEGIDANRRLSSLILTCDDFIASSPNEDIEEKAAQVITKRLPQIQMSAADIQAAHRLQGKNKVIVRFIKRQLRDAVYDSRFELFSGAAGQRQRNSSPLYITESLTPGNRLIYQALLDARRPENGGKIASVFTRRGLVFCRTERGGSNIRVPDWNRLQDILEGPDRRSPPGVRPALPADRGEGPPPPPRAVEASGGGPPSTTIVIESSVRPPPRSSGPKTAPVSAPAGAAALAPSPERRVDAAPPVAAPSAPEPVTPQSPGPSERDGTAARRAGDSPVSVGGGGDTAGSRAEPR